MKKFIALGAAVLTLAVAAITFLLVHDTGPSAAAVKLEQQRVHDAQQTKLQTACIGAGGQWSPTNIWTSLGDGTCQSRFALEEQARKEFCAGLPQVLAHADVPEKCRDFYSPVTTTTRP